MKALELRGFLRGYVAGRDHGPEPHTKAMLEFLEEILLCRADGPREQEGPKVRDAKLRPVTIGLEAMPARETAKNPPPPMGDEPVAHGERPGATAASPESVRTTTEVSSPASAREGKRRGWSPDARAAAADRMRARFADGKMKRRGDSMREAVENAREKPEAPAQADTVGVPWAPDPIEPGEWPDIQRMLADGRGREAIAGDYDVPLDGLNAFIDDRLREGRERRAVKVPPPGEAQAPHFRVAAR